MDLSRRKLLVGAGACAVAAALPAAASDNIAVVLASGGYVPPFPKPEGVAYVLGDLIRYGDRWFTCVATGTYETAEFSQVG